MKKPTPHRHIRPRPMDLRRETVQQLIARLLLLGWSVSRIARKLHCTDRAVRWRMNTEEFQTLFDRLQQEHFKTVHRKLGSLLHGAVDALELMLKHQDWRARDAAVEKILRVHGKYVEKFDITGTLDHTGHLHHVQAELVPGEMTDEMRQKAMELLAMQRQMFQRSLPARFTNHDQDHHDLHDPLNGRFLKNNERGRDSLTERLGWFGGGSAVAPKLPNVELEPGGNCHHRQVQDSILRALAASRLRVWPKSACSPPGFSSTATRC